MEEKRFRIDGIDGSSIHIMMYRGEDSPIGIVHLLHGMAEHCERYRHFASYLVSNGYVVYTHDHRKHGKSIAKGQTIGIFDKKDTFSNVIEDVRIVQDFIKNREKGLELILLGHSMGSLICRRYLQEHGAYVSKAIIMGTMAAQPLLLKVAIISGKIVRLFSSKGSRSAFLNKLVVGGFNLQFEPTRTECDWLSRDNSQVDKYLSDELCGYSYSATFYINLFKEVMISQVKANIKKTPQIPLLFVSGASDPVGFNSEGVKKVVNLYEAFGYGENVSLKLFDGCRHEILNEINKEEVYYYILDWIKNH
ncbi:MAG: alpha/beta hydrolase [Firmicutes bacterium HGW-Firmicutes-1]|jgi:alpha-beta hydrolase superfamily lysophospholipase|nr:MAG: alpha/beta hydrolase [Firmicutes bacterium HGW-Firmicutes-1]